MSDSTPDVDLAGDIGEFVVKDSVVNINLQTATGRRKADDQFHEHRRRLRSLRTDPGRRTANELDSMIVELNEMAESFLRIGSNSIAAQYMALMARGQFMRGKVDLMWKSMETALSLDPNCEFALLHLGEFHSNVARRLNDDEGAQVEWSKAARYLRRCKEHAESDGARNNAGFQLCQALIELGERQEAIEVKGWLLDRVTNAERVEQIESLGV